MRTLRIIFFAFIIAYAFSSCKKDKEVHVDDIPGGEIIGTWNLIEVKYDGTIIANISLYALDYNVLAEGYNYNYSVIFNSDNTFSSDGSYGIHMTMALQEDEETNAGYLLGDTIVQDVHGIDLFGDGSWIIKNDTFSVSNSSVIPTKLEFTLSDENTMNIPFTLAYDETLQGVTQSTEVAGYFIFERR